MKKLISTIYSMLYPVALYLAISFGIALTIRGMGLSIKAEDIVLVLILEQAASIAVILWIYRLQRRKSNLPAYDYQFRDLGFKNIILILLSTYFVLGSISMISVIFSLNESFPGYSEIYELLSKSPILLQIISTVILAPVLEEVLCRGIIYNRMREISGFPVSALVSSLIWAAAHMNVVQGVTAFLYGIFLAFLYEKFKLLRVTIVSHGLFNLIAVASGYFAALPENRQAIKDMTVDPTANITALIIELLIAAWLIFLLYRSRYPRIPRIGN